jgi:hypothetical protein
VLALGALLSGFTPGSEADFVQLGDDGTDTTVAVDPDGAANGASFTALAILSDVAGSALGDLVAGGNIDLTAS